MCELLGIDAAVIESEASRAIPTPKGWASLEDDSPQVTEECPFDPTPTVPASKLAIRKARPRTKRRRSR
jgi:hypothetical protein